MKFIKTNISLDGIVLLYGALKNTNRVGCLNAPLSMAHFGYGDGYEDYEDLISFSTKQLSKHLINHDFKRITK